jgi:hypothetical protein
MTIMFDQIEVVHENIVMEETRRSTPRKIFCIVQNGYISSDSERLILNDLG